MGWERGLGGARLGGARLRGARLRGEGHPGYSKSTQRTK